MAREASPLGHYPFLVPVIYEPDRQRECARGTVRATLDALQEIAQEEFQQHDEIWLTLSVAMNLHTFAMVRKNDGFREEAEYRIAIRAFEPAVPSSTRV